MLLRWIVGSSMLAACGCPSGPEAGRGSSGGEQALDPPAAEVRPIAVAPRRASPPGTATIAFLARGRNAFVAQLEMEPGAEVPEHQDADEEYIIVLQGHGTITIDGTEHAVTPGSTIFMPAGATVSYRNGSERLLAIQVFAGPGSSAKYERWTPVEPDAPE